MSSMAAGWGRYLCDHVHRPMQSRFALAVVIGRVGHDASDALPDLDGFSAKFPGCTGDRGLVARVRNLMPSDNLVGGVDHIDPVMRHGGAFPLRGGPWGPSPAATLDAGPDLDRIARHRPSFKFKVN